MKFKDRDAHISQIVKEKLLTLPAKIPQIKHWEVGIDITRGERSHDLVLVSKFATVEDLKAYGVQPDHVEVLNYLRTVWDVVAVVDYES
jgi:hypothetical protein